MARRGFSVMRRALALALALAASACGPVDPAGPNLPSIRLTAQQAAAIVTRAEAIAPMHPDLAWLADSVEVVIHGGADVVRIAVTVDGAIRNFYAVGLQRAIRTSASSFATWHLIAFNDAANPTEFVLANGYAPGVGTTPPTTVASTFGGSGAFAHLIRVEGSTLRDWRGETGNAVFTTLATGGACAGFVGPPGTTCVAADLQATFTVLTTSSAPASASRAASMGTAIVPGVMLRIDVP